MQLLPITDTLIENSKFTGNPVDLETVKMTIEFYKKVGFVPPWIGYYAEEDGSLVGNAGYKGPPVNGSIEIAYGTKEKYRHKGIGTKICCQLVQLALQTDPTITITARTLLDNNFSARILEKNDFVCIGQVDDPEDGPVWEWIFKGIRPVI